MFTSSDLKGCIKWLLGLMAMLLLAAPAVHAEEEFLDPEQAFVFSAQMQAPSELRIDYRIAPKYYMYRERFEFHIKDDTDKSRAAALLGTPVLPKGEVKYDPTFDKNMEVYHNQVSIRLPLLRQTSPFTVQVVGQGCADAGLCYPPTTYDIVLEPAPGGGMSITGGTPGVKKGAAPAGAVSTPPADNNASGATQASSSSAAGGVTSMLTGKADTVQDSGQTGQQASGATAGSSSDPSPGIAAVSAEAGSASLFDAGDTTIAQWLSEAGLARVLLICFALGVVLSFTPCVLPMLPILLSVIVGDQKARGGVPSKGRGFALTLMYVLGTAIVYTLLGIAAASVGSVLAAWIQNPWVLSAFAVVLVILAIGMFGAFTIQVPVALQTSLNSKVSRMPGGRYGGAFGMGMLSALICGPCVAAPLAGILLFISQTGNLVLGGLALFVLAWGQGFSLLILGATSGALMPKAGPWMEAIKYFCGLLLLATALWMLMPVVPLWVQMLGWAFLSMSLALLLGAFRGDTGPAASAGPLRLLLRALGLLAAAWALLLLVGLATGSRDPLSPLKGIAQGNGAKQTSVAKVQFERVRSLAELEARIAAAGKPVMLDFYADWCISCHEMEKFTFSDSQVAGAMGSMLLLQADVTGNNEQDRELLKRFRLFGPPGIIFFDRNGQEMKENRVVGFQKADKFLEKLQLAQR
ncbi:protein-disulfide reductase DsbD [Advenella mimigardefordensis]|uniref:Thiol:disulfide interchange protein DsbD n=1 Tax=Advenella mimigardefordensis (strain DSM 17166 / LMG 22922 / DPN7) TaxID=1247726 RepID=W0PK60_ADVMD|nr:protein-disulfide reductase DsbD [Advenella mimigardefordensis]AHG65940.1 putative thiol:disulfide interchange protein DsbD [Advenella mimigardefordensis DPN7]